VSRARLWRDGNRVVHVGSCLSSQIPCRLALPQQGWWGTMGTAVLRGGAKSFRSSTPAKTQPTAQLLPTRSRHTHSLLPSLTTSCSFSFPTLLSLNRLHELVMSPAHRPMPLSRTRSPFVHSEVVFELQSVVFVFCSTGSRRSPLNQLRNRWARPS